MFYFAHCMNIIFNSLLAQLVKYDVHTTSKVKFIHAVIYHILLLYTVNQTKYATAEVYKPLLFPIVCAMRVMLCVVMHV